ncbi:MAG: OsmC family protein [Elusimicrobiota bacterium]
MDLMTISQVEDKKFSIELRSHKIESDMHADEGGKDAGMNPIELLVGSLGACIGMTIKFYCDSHKIPCEGLVVNAVPTLAAKPKRVENIAIDISLPEGFPEDRKESILRVAEKCPVHNALKHAPAIDIDIV